MIESVRLDLLELLGKRYLIDHWLIYLKRKGEEARRRAEDVVAAEYLGECVRLVGERLAMTYGGTYVSKSLREMYSPKAEEPEDGDAIAMDIIRRAGLKLKGGDTDGVV